MHLYVGKSGQYTPVRPSWVTKGKIDVVDRVPFIYDNEINEWGFNCAKPLFISNQLSILSPVLKGDRAATLDIWKVFDTKVWICILFALLIIVITDKILSLAKNGNRNNWFNVFWIYFKPLIGIVEPINYKNYLYILWVLTIIHLTEVFKNGILVKLIAVPDLYVNNIDDLLDDRWDVYTPRVDLVYWTNFGRQNSTIDDLMLHKYRKLFDKTIAVDLSTNMPFIKLIDEPKLFIEKLKRSAFFEDDQALKLYGIFLKKFIKLHLAEESYVPKLITPICYAPNFKFSKEAEKMYVFIVYIIKCFN